MRAGEGWVATSSRFTNEVAKPLSGLADVADVLGKSTHSNRLVDEPFVPSDFTRDQTNTNFLRSASGDGFDEAYEVLEALELAGKELNQNVFATATRYSAEKNERPAQFMSQALSGLDTLLALAS